MGIKSDNGVRYVAPGESHRRSKVDRTEERSDVIWTKRKHTQETISEH